MRISVDELARAILAALLFYVLAALIPSAVGRAVSFIALAVVFVVVRLFIPASGRDGLSSLKRSVEDMTEGNLKILRVQQTEAGSTAGEFATSIVLLSARLRMIVEKVKNVAQNVGNTSESIVQLSRTLLKIGQSQSAGAETASRSMAEINIAIKRIAEGAEDLNELGVTVSSAILELTASIEEVTRNAVQVGTFARDTQFSMEKMVHGMKEIEEASAMLVQASGDADAALKNMHRRNRDVSVRASESDVLAERAANAARSGGVVVDDVEAGMEKIALTFQNTSRVIENLSRRSEQIGEILNVITQIADQTNLLSLNAAILSAQAGIHGKGFAVVADEIGKLSNRTSASVKEIEQLISRVREEITSAVALMDEGKTSVSEGLERSAKASEALAEILASSTASRERVAAITESTRAQEQAEKNVQQSSAIIQQRLDQIAHVIREQTHVSDQVYSKAERMIDLLKNVERGMQEQTNGAREVSQTVERLSGIIEEIHAAIAEQSVTSTQVVQSVERLRTAVQSGTSTIRSLNATAQALDQESFILKHELLRFRLPEPQKGGALRIGVTAKVSTLDPVYAQYVFLVDCVYNLYEGLVEFGEGTDIRPLLAERWDISEDGYVYTFRLKRGARFHSGKEVTTADVKASFERLIHPASKSPGAWVFESVEGVEDYTAGKSKSVKGIEIVDAQTLVIRLREPIPFFLGMIAQPYAAVLPAELAARRGAISEVCGTGPFRLERFVPDRVLEMSRFDRYHTPSTPLVDRVTLEMGLDEAQISAGIENGTFSFTTELQQQRLQPFLNRPEWKPRLQTNVQLYTAFLALSSRIPPLNDVRVRQAIACAIDRDRIVREVVGAERAVVAHTLLPPGLPGHDPAISGYNFDPSRAKALLRQAGVAAGTRIECWHSEAASNRDVLEVICENLNEAGIDFQVRLLPPHTFQEAADRGTVPARMTRWVADYPDPDNFLYVTFHSKSPVFNLGFENPEFDRLTREARSLPDIQERIRLYQRAERILMEECCCVVLYHNRAMVLHQENVQGCIPHFTQPVVRLKKVWIS